MYNIIYTCDDTSLLLVLQESNVELFAGDKNITGCNNFFNASCLPSTTIGSSAIWEIKLQPKLFLSGLKQHG